MSSNLQLQFKQGPLPTPTAEGQQISIQTKDVSGTPLFTTTYTAVGYTSASGETLFFWEAMVKSQKKGGEMCQGTLAYAVVPV